MTDAPKLLAPVMPEMLSAWSTTRGQYDWNQRDYIREDLAEAAERAAYLRGLEDAAKVADDMPGILTKRLIAAAIRALAKEG